MGKNLFCYVEEKDIEEGNKASVENKNCLGCRYLEVCEEDLSKGVLVKKSERVVGGSSSKGTKKGEASKVGKSGGSVKSTKKAPKKTAMDKIVEMEDIF